MMKKIAFTFFIVTLLFSACTPHRALDHFSKNKHFERAMTSLQIGTLVNNLETKAVLKVIYLNHVYQNQYQENENFFISLYIANEPYDDDKGGLNHKLYKLKLNDQNATSITELSDDAPLRMEMPVTEKWSHYYHVVFAKQESNDLELTLTHKYQGTILLKYAKDELEK